jgi:ATP synthase protein I
MDSASPQRLPLRVGAMQVGIVLLAGGVAYAWRGGTAAAAAVYGGMIAIVPMLYFAWRVFGRRPGATPQEVVGAALRGEIGKYALTAVLFFFGVAVFAREFLTLLLVFMACQLPYWMLLARSGTKIEN